MKVFKIDVLLKGISDIMFDRFYDHSKEDRPPEKKLHLNEKSELMFPSEGVHSFLFRDMPPVGVIRFVEKKSAKDYIAIGQSSVFIGPTRIPFLDEKEKPVKFSGFGDGSQFYINDWSAGLTKISGGKVVKQEIRKRPVLRAPWALKFNIEIFPNDKVSPEKLKTYFEVGGLAIAIGTYRPRYGRFLVQEWNNK